MKKSARNKVRSQETTTPRKAVDQQASPQLAFAAMLDARATLHDAIVSAGMSVLGAMLEEERTRLCGPRYRHSQERVAIRGGHVDGELSVGGRRVRIRRPRVSGVDGAEWSLETWQRRNVEDHLPEGMRRNVGRTMSAAYQSGNAGRARRMLEGLANQLERKHPSAAASLREGLDGTLTVMRLNLQAGLARTLSTTNPIEFINGRI